MLSKKSIQFLDDLKANNNREWFLANKKRYEEYKLDYHQLIGAFLEVMKPKDASLEMLEIKNCTFRINRDIRFSKDKSPYKSHMGIWMNTNSSGINAPGYYIHIEKGKSFVAGGLYSPEASDLKKIRKEIAFFYEDLEEIVTDATFKKFYTGLDRNETNALKNAPKDFEKDHPAIEFLKLKSFTVSTKIDDSELIDKNFVATTVEKLIALKPLIDFLNRGLASE
ncbi:DUF2461 domain-containing protein [Flavobacterium luteum]|uniref:DUF2461 domain-containing protein n=1 Tax=Flavobacterium luteum TaxID=2026654 RepID=A0A7J5ABX9_9FLAO|nr:DUF2461 domain-containing protein [Flavobacterium luteum]KAB1155066.1 DUF2461 domain-containing protein [Flavobacterium luteum]